MDLIEQLVNLADAIAWPLVVLTIFVLLRKPIVRFLPRLQRLKYKDAEIEFQEIASELKHDFPASKENIEEITQIEKRLKALARSSPRLSIIEAWSQVEFSLGKYAAFKKHITEGEKVYAQISYDEVAKQIFGEDSELFRRYHDLRALRNKAVHEQGFEPNHNHAYAFAVLASRLISTINENIKP